MRPEPEDESHAAFQRIAPQPPKLRTEAAPETAARGDTGRIPASRFVLGLLLVLLAGGAALWGLPRLLSTSPPAPRASTPAPSSVPAGDPPPAAAAPCAAARACFMNCRSSAMEVLDLSCKILLRNLFNVSK